MPSVFATICNANASANPILDCCNGLHKDYTQLCTEPVSYAKHLPDRNYHIKLENGHARRKPECFAMLEHAISIKTNPTFI